MYHYTAVVSHAMPDCEGAPSSAWQRIIPQLSFDSEVVLNPMLALSALHLHSHSPDDSNMAIALRRYVGRTLVNHRQSLLNGEEFSEQLWLSAVLLTHIYWLLAHQPQPDEAYELPYHVYKMAEGIGILFKQKKKFLSRLGYEWVGNEIMHHMASTEELSIAAQAQLRGIEEDLAYLLDAFDVPAQPEDDRSIYIEARDYVLYHYRAFYFGAATKALQRFIISMTVRCQPGYRSMLERHDPLAMALMARLLVLLSGLNYAWWVNGVGDYEVMERDVRGIHELMPANFRWAMNWPCKVLDGEIILTRD